MRGQVLMISPSLATSKVWPIFFGFSINPRRDLRNTRVVNLVNQSELIYLH